MSHDNDQFDASGAHYQPHYSHPVCPAIELCEELSFNLGSALKYLWRAGKKGDAPLKGDLEDALWYLKREQARIQTVSRDARSMNEQLHALAGLIADVWNGTQSFGVPLPVKKLARIVAHHEQSSDLLREVILSLADDRQEFGVAVGLVEEAIRALPAEPSKGTQEG
jgi:hypothetical protein